MATQSEGKCGCPPVGIQARIVSAKYQGDPARSQESCPDGQGQSSGLQAMNLKIL